MPLEHLVLAMRLLVCSSTPWLMFIVVQVRFETNASGLKPLQDKLYVGSGRFIVEENQPIIVEYKISEVGAQCSEQPEGG